MSKAETNAKPEEFGDFLGAEPKTGGNEKTVIKSKLMSVVASMQVMDEERENIKEVLSDLKEAHSIPPKVGRAVAKIMHTPEHQQDMEAHMQAIELLLERLK